MPEGPTIPRGYIGLGAPQWLMRAAEAMGLTGPGAMDVMRAAHQRFQDVARREGPGAALRDPQASELGTAAGSQFNFTSPLALHAPVFAGIFAGQGAKTADLAALDAARKLEASGADPHATWQKTGWFKSPDGQWRFEIDDSTSRSLDTPAASAARVGASFDRKGGEIPQAASLEQVFSHPELARAYFPTRESTPDVYYANMGNTRGQYRSQGAEGPGEVLIDQKRLFSDNGERSTMLHELQHMVQDREGFARGTSDYMIPTTTKEDRANLQRAWETINTPTTFENWTRYGHDPESGKTPEQTYQAYVAQKAKDAKRFPNAAEQKLVAGYMYRNSAGEAEARAVQARADMTPEQRRAAFPLESYDVPLDRLLVRRR